MRLGRLFIIIAIVLIIGVGGLFFVANSLGGDEEAAAEEASSKIQVVIIEQFVPRGGTITSDVLGFASLPADDVIQDVYILDPEEMVGGRARYDLLPGVFLSRAMVLSPGEGLATAGSDTSLDIQPGMVAIAIPLDRFSSVGYGLQRGDHVNIIVSMLFVDLDTEFQTILPNSTAAIITPGNVVVISDGDSGSIVSAIDGLSTLTAQTVSGGLGSPDGRIEFDSAIPDQFFYIVPSEPTQRPRLVSQTILQDVVVIHVGDFPLSEEDDTAAAPAEGQPQPGEGQPQDAADSVPEEIEPPDIITLMVFPQEAVTLNYLVLQGAYLSLVMRASGDDSRVFTEAVTLDWLLATHNIPVPSRLPYGFEPRLDRIISPAAQAILDSILASGENQ